MKLFVFLLLLPLAAVAEAPKEGECTPQMLQEALKYLEKVAFDELCVAQKLNVTDEKLVQKLAAGSKDAKTVNIYVKPTSRTSSSITYELEPEVALQPGEALYFGVPPDIARRSVRFAVLGHRQDKAREKGFGATRAGWDDVPGITSVQFHSSTDQAHPWRYWMGDASGKFGGKFAEVRSAGQPEIENLYEFRLHGHGGIDGSGGTTDPLYADAIRLVSSGKDEVLISQITMKVAPPKADRYISQTFSPGTNLGDAEGVGAKYGGGQGFQGKFPGALVLPSWSKGWWSEKPTLPPGWRVQGPKLYIPLPAGVNVTGLELAMGDSHSDGVRNKDGGWGSLGYAKVSARIHRSHGPADVLMNRENVPPEGVLVGTPQDGCYKTQPGDELEVETHLDTSYIMGLRIGVRDTQ
jgi:hypothetical protein